MGTTSPRPVVVRVATVIHIASGMLVTLDSSSIRLHVSFCMLHSARSSACVLSALHAYTQHSYQEIAPLAKKLHKQTQQQLYSPEQSMHTKGMLVLQSAAVGNHSHALQVWLHLENCGRRHIRSQNTSSMSAGTLNRVFSSCSWQQVRWCHGPVHGFAQHPCQSSHCFAGFKAVMVATHGSSKILTCAPWEYTPRSK